MGRRERERERERERQRQRPGQPGCDGAEERRAGPTCVGVGVGALFLGVWARRRGLAARPWSGASGRERKRKQASKQASRRGKTRQGRAGQGPGCAASNLSKHSKYAVCRRSGRAVGSGSESSGAVVEASEGGEESRGKGKEGKQGKGEGEERERCAYCSIITSLADSASGPVLWAGRWQALAGVGKRSGGSDLVVTKPDMAVVLA